MGPYSPSEVYMYKPGVLPLSHHVGRLTASLLTKKKDKDKREGKGCRCCLGGHAESFNFYAALAILHEDVLKNRVN